MIWFWVPISLVIVNDVAAYVCGMLFGRHQLIKLSPKKTVEGFVGALFVTMIFAYFVSYPWDAYSDIPIAGVLTIWGTVGHILHAVRLHALPRAGPIDQRPQ